MMTDTEKCKDFSKEIRFLLCKACFWCASYLRTFCCVYSICPICHKETIEAYPLFYAEVVNLITSNTCAAADQN
jgi:hypothetical protein